MDLLRRSLEELIPIAEDKGVTLGFENREDLEELPMDEDMPALLEEYCVYSNVGYWYDPGHAQEKSEYGVMTTEENLRLNGPYLAGVHFQDYSEEGKAHRPIGQGIIDFDPIFQYLKPDAPCILELSPSSNVESILSSKEYLEEKLDKKVEG
jgi:sugar phosphate isomerase/epimerase